MWRGIAAAILGGGATLGGLMWLFGWLLRGRSRRPQLVIQHDDPRNPVYQQFADRFAVLNYLLLQIWASDSTSAQLGTDLTQKLRGYFGTRMRAPEAPAKLNALIREVTRLEDWLRDVQALEHAAPSLPPQIRTAIDGYLVVRQKSIGG